MRAERRRLRKTLSERILPACAGHMNYVIIQDSKPLKEKEDRKMNLLYKSTRNNERKVTASEAILKGLAEDGGLFVPEFIPKLDVTMDDLKDMTYQETAYAVMKQFLTDFTEEELKHCIDSAYDSKFDTEVIAPLVKVGDVYHLELFHGATIAFKDMALSILPHLLTTAAKKNNVKNDIVILTDFSNNSVNEREFFRTITPYFKRRGSKMRLIRNMAVQEAIKGIYPEDFLKIGRKEFDVVVQLSVGLLQRRYRTITVFEIDGGEHLGNALRRKADKEKMEICQKYGVKLIRIANSEVKDYELIIRLFECMMGKFPTIDNEQISLFEEFE